MTKTKKDTAIAPAEQLDGQLTLDVSSASSSADSGRRKQMNTLVPGDLYRAIKDYCASHNVQISAFVEAATAEYIKDDIRHAVPAQATAMDQFDSYLDNIKDAYYAALQASATAYDVAADKVRRQLATLQATVAKNQELEDRIKEQSKMYADLRNQKQDLEAKIKDKDQIIEQLNQDLAASASAAEAAEAAEKAAKEELTAALAARAAAETETAKVKAELAEVKAVKAEAEAEAAKAQIEAKAHADQLASALDKADAARTKAEKAAVDQQRLQDLTIDNQRLQATVAELRGQIDRLQQDHADQIARLHTDTASQMQELMRQVMNLTSLKSRTEV